MNTCTYCDNQTDDDGTMCVASGEAVCSECVQGHVSSCGACAYEMYEAK